MPNIENNIPGIILLFVLTGVITYAAFYLLARLVMPFQGFRDTQVAQEVARATIDKLRAMEVEQPGQGKYLVPISDAHKVEPYAEGPYLVSPVNEERLKKTLAEVRRAVGGEYLVEFEHKYGGPERAGYWLAAFTSKRGDGGTRIIGECQEDTKARDSTTSGKRAQMQLSSHEGGSDDADGATIITVCGVRSAGMGKTTIATNLSAALAQQSGRRVALVDLDVRFGDVAIMMDVPGERSIADLALPDEQIDQDALRSCLYSHKSGVAILPAPIRPSEWQAIHAGHIERVVTLLAQAYDYVILDMPAVLNDVVAHALDFASILVLVTAADEPSLNETRLALGMPPLGDLPTKKVKLVVNELNVHAGGQSRIEEAPDVDLKQVGRILGKKVSWSIPYDRNITQATQLGMPIVAAKPNSRAAQSIICLAEMLARLDNRRHPQRRAARQHS